MNEILSGSGKESGEAKSQVKEVRFANDVQANPMVQLRVNAPVGDEAGTKIMQAPRVEKKVTPPRVIEKEKHPRAVNAPQQNANNKVSATGPTT